jgi:hypothetical protein
MPAQSIAVNSHWQDKKSAGQVTVTRVTIRTVSYIALFPTAVAVFPRFPARDGAQEEDTLVADHFRAECRLVRPYLRCGNPTIVLEQRLCRAQRSN